MRRYFAVGTIIPLFIIFHRKPLILVVTCCLGFPHNPAQTDLILWGFRKYKFDGLTAADDYDVTDAVLSPPLSRCRARQRCCLALHEPREAFVYPNRSGVIFRFSEHSS